MKNKYIKLILLILFHASIFGQDLQPIPELWQRVTDLTGTLSSVEIDTLDSKLFAFEKEKGSQIAVLIINTAQPEAIEEYSIRVAEQWKIGREEIDDGVILLVALDDRTLRIEVGYGLEGIIPDATAKSIIDNIIIPHFRNGNIFLGIDKGVDALISYIKQEPLPEPTNNYQYTNYEYNPFNETLFMIFLFFIIISAIVAPFIFGQLWGRLGSLIVAILIAIIFYDSVTVMSFIIMNLFFSLFSIPGAWKGSGSGSSYRSSSSYSSGSSYRSSSYSSSSSSSSRSSFSGGGGSFGGGGASGRW